ncbi:MAG: DUF4293 domain-containing protein [Bacteroidales bacterium]|nr:DUF4293 domain-containing protein [Bacteroidales bacterium]
MIQRIQSIYLLLSAIFTGVACALPLVQFSSLTDNCTLYAFSLQQAAESANLWSLGIAFSATAILNLVIIFLFSKRRLQIKLTHYAFLLKLAILAVIAYYSYLLNAPEVSIKPAFGLICIPIAMVLDWMAVKAIRKDEELVRSVDRIR